MFMSSYNPKHFECRCIYAHSRTYARTRTHTHTRTRLRATASVSAASQRNVASARPGLAWPGLGETLHCASHLCCKHKFDTRPARAAFCGGRVTIKRVIITITVRGTNVSKSRERRDWQDGAQARHNESTINARICRLCWPRAERENRIGNQESKRKREKDREGEQLVVIKKARQLIKTKRLRGESHS